jgi:hypothetical protein
VKLSHRPNPCLPPKSALAGFRFPAEVIVVAVRWYLRFNLSYPGALTAGETAFNASIDPATQQRHRNPSEALGHLDESS